MTFGITAGEKKLTHTYTTALCNGTTAVNVLPANPLRQYIIFTAVRGTRTHKIWPGDGLTIANAITRINNSIANDGVFFKVEGPAAQLAWWSQLETAGTNEPLDIYQGF